MATAAEIKPTVAFFGATGGCASAALALSLKAGYPCVALARTPSKLSTLLKSKFAIPEDLLQSHLAIVEGDAKDEAAVTKTLYPADGPPVDIIISGLGSYPSFYPNPLKPRQLDPSLCGDSMRVLTSVLKTRSSGPSKKKPSHICAVSTTGISEHGRDIPTLMVPLYKYMLEEAHADKKIMESVLQETISLPADQRPLSSGGLIVRASLLTDGAELGKDHVRAGYETSTEFKPAIGYRISRADVGAWIFQEVVEGRGDGWLGKTVSLTY